LTPCSNRDWQAYIERKLAPDSCLEYELHLYTCDECLPFYIQAVEASQQIPANEATKQTTDTIMAAIQSGNQETAARTAPHIIIIAPKRKQLPLTRRPLFQYGVAAIITLMLMSAGVFQGLSMRISHIEHISNKDQQESFSQKLMEKTVAVLDIVQAQPKGGKNP
jgi:hypothetical protein